MLRTAAADGTGWFSQSQVESGRLGYAANCQTCHGAQLQGTGAPSLKGRSFDLLWNGKTLDDLYSYVHKQMPLGNPASLPAQEYADIVAFILAQNGLPAGPDKLTPTTPMNRVLRALGDRHRVATSRGNGTGQARRAHRPGKAADDIRTWSIRTG